MANPYEALRQTSTREVSTVVDGVTFDYRLRRITHEDSMRAGGGLLMATVEVLGTNFDKLPEDEQRKRMKTLAEKLGSGADTMAQTARLTAAGVCASVTHVRVDGDEWYPLRLVLDLEDENPDAGEMHISILTGDQFTALASAAKSLTQGQGVSAALATFRDASGGAIADAA